MECTESIDDGEAKSCQTTTNSTNLLKRAKAGDEDAIRDFLAQVRAGSSDDGSFAAFRGSSGPNLTRPTSFSRSGRAFSSIRGEIRREFENAEHLRGFLFGMVRNKVREQHRRLTRTGSTIWRARSGCMSGEATARFCARSFRRSRRPARRFRPPIGWRS